MTGAPILLAAVMALAGCAAGSNAAILTNSKSRDVTVDGVVLTVAPLEGDNWGVTNKIPHWGPRVMTLEKPRYVRAVEAVTGCKVVDSEYDGYLDHLHARVDCTK